jgi:prepilin peptidase CpaA
MWIPLLTPSLILLGATYTDVKSRKIYNWYFISSAIVAIISTFLIFGTPGLLPAVGAAGLAILLTLPLVLAKVMGAGDMKIMAAFGLATSVNAVLSVVLYGFVWALVFGLISIFIRGETKVFLRNMKLFIFGLRPASESLHRIPFTVALLMGWISYVLGSHTGGF